MEIDIIKETRRFKDLESSWNNLNSKNTNNHIFITFDWQFEWWQHFKEDRSTLFIVVVRENQEVIGIAPLMLTKRLGFNVLRFIGYGISDYEDLIICDEARKNEVITGILGKISQSNEWDILRLVKLRFNPQDLNVLKQAQKEQKNLVALLQQHQEGAPFISINGRWDEYSATFRKKFIADTRRQINRLKVLDQNFKVMTVNRKEDIAVYLEELNLYHRQKCKKLKDHSIFSNKIVYDFLLKVAERFSDRGWLSLSYILIKDITAAVHLGFSFNNVFYYYLPGYNSEFYKYSIGRILLLDLLRQSFDSTRTIKKFDFMLGEEDYKREWNAQVEPLYFLTIYKKTSFGYAAYLIFNRLNLLFKKLMKKRW